MQRKSIDLSLSNIKAQPEGKFEGYASVFGNIDLYGDIIETKAFSKSLVGRKFPVAMLHQHKPSEVIGKWTSITEDDYGLYVVGELTPGHSIADNVKASLLHGAMNGMSIGFDIVDHEEKNGNRIIKSIDLWEISVVTFPANQESRIESVKSAIDSIKSLTDAEILLRDTLGLSRLEAKSFISQVKSLSTADALDQEALLKLKESLSFKLK
jgi:HK97 family phage prohead protease